jgi:hypothetical protein
MNTKTPQYHWPQPFAETSVSVFGDSQKATGPDTIQLFINIIFTIEQDTLPDALAHP